MDSLREKAIKAIKHYDVFINKVEGLLDLPELAAYYGSKGAGVVAKKECDCGETGITHKDGCTGFVARELTNDELVEWAKWIILSVCNGNRKVYAADIYMLPSGERVEIKEGE